MGSGSYQNDLSLSHSDISGVSSMSPYEYIPERRKILVDRTPKHTLTAFEDYTYTPPYRPAYAYDCNDDEWQMSSAFSRQIHSGVEMESSLMGNKLISPNMQDRYLQLKGRIPFPSHINPDSSHTLRPEHKKNLKVDYKSIPKVVDYQSIPRLEYKLIPKVDHQSIPRVEYKLIPKVDYQSIPRVEYKSIPKVEYHIIPKVEYQSCQFEPLIRSSRPVLLASPREEDYSSGLRKFRTSYKTNYNYEDEPESKIMKNIYKQVLGYNIDPK